MAYSKAYQEVIAGRVREDEMPFFSQNRVAAPPNTFVIVNKDATKQPSIRALGLQDVNVGKKDNRSCGKEVYLPYSYDALPK